VPRKEAATASKPNERYSTRERVARAALQLFAEKGFHGTGIRDLAQAAGLTTSTLYHYMENKDDLLVEIMVGTITPLNEAAVRIDAAQPDPAARLCMLVEQHVWAHASDRLATLVTDTELRALSGERRARVLAIRDAYEDHWRKAVGNGAASGRFDVAIPDLTARALLQMATGVSHWFSPSGQLQLEALCHEYADAALALVRARGEGGRALRRADLELPPATFYFEELPPSS
jgi:AcrR family transcriptional regulator